TKEEIRKPEIIHQRRTEDASDTQQTLVCPSQLADPIRRKGVCRGGSAPWVCESPAAGLGINKESCMLGGKSAVHAEAELVSDHGTRCDPAEVSKVRPKQSRSAASPLLVTLPVPKEEKPVAPYRTTHCDAKLPPLEKRIRVGRIPGQ